MPIHSCEDASCLYPHSRVWLDLVQPVYHVERKVLKCISNNHGGAAVVEIVEEERRITHVQPCRVASMTSKVDHKPWPVVSPDAPKLAEQAVLGFEVPPLVVWRKACHAADNRAEARERWWRAKPEAGVHVALEQCWAKQCSTAQPLLPLAAHAREASGHPAPSARVTAVPLFSLSDLHTGWARLLGGGRERRRCWPSATATVRGKVVKMLDVQNLGTHTPRALHTEEGNDYKYVIKNSRTRTQLPFEHSQLPTIHRPPK
eukprot:scaffold36106_cov34-Tisochrysis_lutea.AAC.2